ncbi:MAG: hypothetical protein ACO3MF_00870 [Acholeplasmataceae bacterium]
MFEQLIYGSVHHLTAFERALARETGDNICDGLGRQVPNESNIIGKKGPQFKGENI